MASLWVNLVNTIPILRDFLTTGGNGPPISINTTTGKAYYLGSNDIIYPIRGGVGGILPIVDGAVPPVFIQNPDGSLIYGEV